MEALPSAPDLSAVAPMQRRNGERAPGLVHEYLRELILDGTIPPESVISQVKLARQLGVSRTPLREALRRLQQEGLVDAEPNRRARVTGFDADDLERVYTSRILYEPLGLSLTVPRLSAEHLHVIEDALEEMRRHAATGDYPAWEEAHRRFHRSLVMHASDSLKRTIATFADRGDRYRRLYQSAIPRAWEIGDSEHEAIVQACRARNEREAVLQLARHFGRTALALMARMIPERDPVEVRGALLLVTGNVHASVVLTART